jgi:cytochrome P450
METKRVKNSKNSPDILLPIIIVAAQRSPTPSTSRTDYTDETAKKGTLFMKPLSVVKTESRTYLAPRISRSYWADCSDKNRHDFLRRVMQPSFNTSTLDLLSPTIEEFVNRVVRTLFQLAYRECTIQWFETHWKFESSRHVYRRR